MRVSSFTLFSFCLLPMLVLGQPKGDQFAPLLQAAKKSHSDALIVIQEGKKIINYHTGSEKEKIESMSVTKSIVGLAIAKLLTDNKLDSLDTPVAHYYPEWWQGRKQDITIRHLMNHTSGLQNVPNTSVEIQPRSDLLQLALCASVVDKPGTKFSYNNKAVNILSGIIKQEADQKMDDYLRDGLFKELGITDFNWRTDDTGNLLSMAGFQVRPTDLAKLGQLVLHKGSWNGKQLIAEKWIDELLTQAQPHTIKGGLLWWRIPAESKLVIDEKQIQKLEEAGLSPEFLSRMENIKGEYRSQGAAVNALMSEYGKSGSTKFRQLMFKKDIAPWRGSAEGPIIGYKAKGYLGQTLVVFPEENLVAVRMIKASKDYNNQTDGFSNFSHMVYKLATASDNRN